jgi:hypothetical protein
MREEKGAMSNSSKDQRISWPLIIGAVFLGMAFLGCVCIFGIIVVRSRQADVVVVPTEVRSVALASPIPTDSPPESTATPQPTDTAIPPTETLLPTDTPLGAVPQKLYQFDLCFV